MDGNTILQLGYPPGKAVGLALHAYDAALAEGTSAADALDELASVLAAPEDFAGDPLYGALAETLIAVQRRSDESAGDYDLGDRKSVV